MVERRQPGFWNLISGPLQELQSLQLLSQLSSPLLSDGIKKDILGSKSSNCKLNMHCPLGKLCHSLNYQGSMFLLPEAFPGIFVGMGSYLHKIPTERVFSAMWC